MDNIITSHNALIYFSEGPYIELLEKAPVSQLTLWALKGIGQGQVAKRLSSWKDAPPGFFEICLETTTPHLKAAKPQMQQLGQPYFCTKSQRKDPQQRLLQWQLLFPHNTALPFIMTPFNINPKPQNFVHPNGMRQIKQCTYNNTPAHLKMVRLPMPGSALVAQGRYRNYRRGVHLVMVKVIYFTVNQYIKNKLARRLISKKQLTLIQQNH